jgi:flagellin
MGMTIRTDLSAMVAATRFSVNYNDVFSAMERLATGRSINRASDDPAGLVISEQLKSQISSLNREIENVANVINKYETVSASVTELRGGLTELRSLALGATNSAGNSEEAQEAYATAASALVNSYNRTIANAHYNGAATLDGSEGSLAEVAPLEGIDLSSPEAAAASIEAIDQAAKQLDGVTSNLGATQKYDLESKKQSLEVTRQNLTAAESTLAWGTAS